MKIRTLEIKEDKVLKDIKLNFEINNKILDTIVIAGSNGSGKTTLLESIYNGIKSLCLKSNSNIKLNFEFENFDKIVMEKNGAKDYFSMLNNVENSTYDEKEYKNLVDLFPKIIYIPAESKFDSVSNAIPNMKIKYKFLNIIDNTTIKNIPSYIASRITYIANTEENLTMKEVREKVNNEINGIFDILDVDVKLKGVSKDEMSIPIFTNSLGDEFDINGLSSGEKQLFLRTLAIKMLEPKNSIILIDEPELSLHPKWQSKIIDVYKKIGENNQLIIATHSPHILGSVSKENIILLNKDFKGEVFSMTGDELYSSYGQTVDRILEDIMGMQTTRNEVVYDLLEKTRELVREDKFDTLEFKEKYQKLREILGETDKELLLINMEVQRRKRGIKNV